METRETVTLQVPSDTRYISLVGACTIEACRSIRHLPDPERTTYDIQLAVDEAVVNAIEHAHSNQPDREVRVVFSFFPERLEIDIYDHGKGVDLEAVPEPNLEEPRESGYGLMIVKQLMDEVCYHRDAVHGNRLHLVKHLTGEDNTQTTFDHRRP